MKKRYIVFGIIILTFVFFVNYAKNSIHSDVNKAYISVLMKNDRELKKKFGNINDYKVKKTARVFNQKDVGTYDSYTIFVNGEKADGLVRIKLFKNKSGEIEKHTVN